VIRLLSYNIKFGGRGRESAIAQVIRAAAVDVVLLQEATDPRVIERLSEETGMPHWGSRPEHSMGFLTRIPVEHHEWHHPLNSRHPFLELALEGIPCRIFGLHLVAWFSKWTERKRARELRALLDGIRKHQEGCHLIAGDFNALAPGEKFDSSPMPRWIRGMVWLSGRDIARSTISMMQSDGYVDAWRVLHRDLEKDPGYTFPVWNPHVRLDYVFTPTEFASRFTACEVRHAPDAVRTASDHLPLLVDISDT